MASAHSDLVNRLISTWTRSQATPPVIHLTGDDSAGQEDVAAAIVATAGLHLFVLNAEDVPASVIEVDALSTLCEREMRLVGGVLLVQCAATPAAAAVVAFANRLGQPLFVASREPVRLQRPVLTCAVDKPEPIEQKRLWREVLGDRGVRLNGSLDAMAAHFRLSARAIATIADSAAM